MQLLLRQQILLSYFKTMSVGPFWGVNLDLPHSRLVLYQLCLTRLVAELVFNNSHLLYGQLCERAR